MGGTGSGFRDLGSDLASLQALGCHFFLLYILVPPVVARRHGQAGIVLKDRHVGLHQPCHVP